MAKQFFTKEDVRAVAPAAVEAAIDGFMSVPKSFTIRQGKVTGKDQLEERIRRALAAAKKAA